MKKEIKNVSLHIGKLCAGICRRLAIADVQMFCMMKRLVILVLMLCSYVFAFAQMQKCVVKTRGRMVGGVLVHGSPLPDVLVQVGGRQPMMAKDGYLSFPVTAGKYELKSVTKQGYTLVDAEVCRWYSFSANPLTIVMEKPGQQMQDKLSAERKIRRQLQERLRQREDEIEALHEQNRITVEQYHNALQELYSRQEGNEKLISDMARRYSELDYDQLDEFQRQVSYCIENGQLSKADSLLRSRGDVARQVEASLKAGAAIQQQREEMLKAEAVYKAEIEEVAQRCYNYYELFAARFQNDSAAYYLQLRTTLDTSNVEWLFETAYFVEFYLADYPKALSYYRQMLRHAVAKHGPDHPAVALAHTGIGRVFCMMSNTDSATHCFDKAMAIRRKHYGNGHPLVANSLLNIGECRLQDEQFDKAADYFIRALKIYRTSPNTSNDIKAECYNSLGICYMNLGSDYAQQAKDNFFEALAIIDTATYGSLHPGLSLIYLNIANLYADQYADYGKAMDYYGKCMAIENQLFGENHPRVARLYDNMAANAIRMGDYEKALDYSLRSIEINKRFFGADHMELTSSYTNMGLMYWYTGQWDKSLQYLKKTEKIMVESLGAESCQLHQVYFIMGGAYSGLDINGESLNCFGRALDIQQRCLAKDDTFVALTHYNMAEVYREDGDDDKALEHYAHALEIFAKSDAGDDTARQIRKIMEEIKKRKTD